MLSYRLCLYTVNTPPTGSITYSPSNPCPGEPVNLGVLTSNCTSGLTYLWSNGATTPTITVNPMVSTTYTVTVTCNGCSTVVSQLVNINTNCTPVQFCRYIDDGITSATSDRGESVIKTSDGGIALVGTLFQTTTDNEIYFVKYAADMTPQCSLRLGDLVSGGTLRETGFTVLQASDGFYYVAGTVILSDGTTDVFVVKLNLANCPNPIVWSNRYGANAYSESAAKMVEMTGTPYEILIVGSATNAASTTADLMAMKISSGGLTPVARVYFPFGNNTRDAAHDVIRLTSGRFIIVGESIGSTDNAVVISIDQNLVMGASKIIDGGRNEIAYGVVERGSEIFVVGRSSQSAHPNNDVVVFRMNAALSGAVSAFVYGTSATTSQEIGFSIKRTVSDRLLIAGSSYTSTTTNLDGLLLQVNPASMSAGFWGKRTSQAGYYLRNDVFYDVVEISTGNFVVTGYTGLTSPSTDEEIFIGKFDNLSSSLNECCLVNYPMIAGSYLPPSPTIDQKGITISANSHGIRTNYYAEFNTCNQYSSFKMQGEQVMQNPEVAFQEIKISPNPSTGIFKFQNTGIWEETIMLRIFDSSGRLIISDKIISGSNNMFEFDGRSLKEGIYFVEVLTDGGKFRSKISIQKQIYH